VARVAFGVKHGEYDDGVWLRHERLAALAHNWKVGVWHLESNRLEHLFDAPKGISADNAAFAIC
jgi:hypothetical protein